MNKFLISFTVLFNIIFVFGNNLKLEKTKQKYFQSNTISYTATAFYPNPDTEEVSSFSIFYKVFKPKSKDYEFYSKNENSEEYFINGNYSEVNGSEKTIYQYENIQNQKDYLKSSRLVQYGPVSLLKRDWNFVNDVVLNGKKKAHYSLIDDLSEYEGKKLKVEFHIYISPDFTISKFERKSFVDNKLGQTVTFEYSNYLFSKSNDKLKLIFPENYYSLKYYERIENIKPLEINSKAPVFDAEDIFNQKVTFQYLLKKKTLLLFSSTNCGASLSVFEFIKNSTFKLSNDFQLVDIFGSDKKEIVLKLFKNKNENFTIIASRKDIETQYGINGTPMLYVVNENGLITDFFDGSEQILKFLNTIKIK